MHWWFSHSRGSDFEVVHALNSVHSLRTLTSFPSALFSSGEMLQMVLSVGEHAVSTRQDWAWLRQAQGENEAADARVWTGCEQLRHLGPWRQRALKVLYEVPNGYADVGAMAHDEHMNVHSLKTVISRADRSVVWDSRYCCTGSVSGGKGVRSRPAVLVWNLLKKYFEESLETLLHLKEMWDDSLNRTSVRGNSLFLQIYLFAIFKDNITDKNMWTIIKIMW